MSKKKHTAEPIGEVKIIKDFLPSPKELVLKEAAVKVTLLLNKNSVDYFKKEAQKHHSHYQVMIRVLLDKYAEHYNREASSK